MEALEMTFDPELAGVSEDEAGPVGAVDSVPAVVCATDWVEVGVTKG
jgi:hypothetical protein